MKKKIVLLLLIFTVYLSLAQNFKQFGSSPQGTSVNFQIDSIIQGIDGNPLYYEDWRKGVIRYSREDYMVNLDEMNINLISNEIAFNKDKRTYIVPNKLDIQQVEFENDTFQLIDYKGESQFFRVEYKGKYSILELVTAKFIEGTPPKGYVSGSNDRHERYTQFFIQFPDQTLQEINPKKGKKIFKILETKTKELKEFINNNDIELNQMRSLVRAIDYYNSLQ